VDRSPVFAVALALVVLTACQPEPKMAVLCPKSGEAEVYGRAVDNGIQMALSEARERSILPAGFRLHEVDTGSSAKRAAGELRRLALRHGVPLVVGGVTTDEAQALLEVAEQRRVVCLSPSAPATDLARRSRYFYRLYATDEVEGRTAARYLANRLGVRRLLVYTDDSSLTRGVEAEFRQHFEFVCGGRVVDTIHLDNKRWLKKSKDALHIYDPEAVYIVGHATSISLVLGHLAGSGFRPIRCTTSAFYVTDVLNRCGDLANGVIFPLPAYDAASIRQPVQEFVTGFEGRFGVRPDIYSAHGYDAMRLALHSLCAGNALRASQLRRYFSIELQQFDGVTGTIAFNGDGDATRYPIMHCVWQGQVISCEELRRLKLRKVQEILEGLVPSRCVRTSQDRATRA
jgi:branched-chain amino acid transport system substrate-binding protein